MGFSRQEYWSGLPLPSPSESLSTMNGGDKIPSYIHRVPKAVMGSGGFIKLPLFPGGDLVLSRCISCPGHLPLAPSPWDADVQCVAASATGINFRPVLWPSFRCSLWKRNLESVFLPLLAVLCSLNMKEDSETKHLGKKKLPCKEVQQSQNS